MILDIRKRIGYVTELQGAKVLLSLAAETVLEHFNGVQVGHRTVVADVIDAPRCVARRGIRSVALPCRVRLRNALQHARDALGYVLDESEVARRPVVGSLNSDE
jgi:hypothetical protein